MVTCWAIGRLVTSLNNGTALLDLCQQEICLYKTQQEVKGRLSILCPASTGWSGQMDREKQAAAAETVAPVQVLLLLLVDRFEARPQFYFSSSLMEYLFELTWDLNQGTGEDVDFFTFLFTYFTLLVQQTFFANPLWLLSVIRIMVWVIARKTNLLLPLLMKNLKCYSISGSYKESVCNLQLEFRFSLIQL